MIYAFLSFLLLFQTFSYSTEGVDANSVTSLNNLLKESVAETELQKSENTYFYEKSQDRNLNIKDTSYEKGVKNQEKISSFEAFVGSGLRQYGYDFFYKAPSSFIPDQNVPVTPDYLIGPGDQIVITVWGRMNAKWSLDVSREGTVSIPKIGIINVAGIKFENLKDFLKKEISRYYTDFDINVSMGNIRSIRIYVVGNASNPGAYTVSGLSTMINALFEAGGPSKNGTMRAIELRRGGETISTLDLYDFFLKGDKTKDRKLINDDVIFIRPIGGLAAISDGVKNPGIYEFKSGDKILDLVQMAGGFANTAYNKKLSIRRIFNNQYRDYIDMDISDIENNPSKNQEIKDGDYITIRPIVEVDSSISVFGAVVYPGKIGIKGERTTLSQAIKLAGGLLENASDIAEITRFHKTSEGVKTERWNIDLKKALSQDQSSDIQLQPDDVITVKSIPNWYEPITAEISGEVQSPGSYVIEKGEKLSSLLKRANGFTDKAFPRGIVFIRETVRQQQQKNIEEIAQRLEKEIFSQAGSEISTSLSAEEAQSKKAIFEQKQKFIEKIKNLKALGRVYIKLESIEKLKNSPYDIELMSGDKIIIPQKSDVVNVSGAVMASGSYVYKSSSYKSYIDMAGGYSYYADKGRAFILRADGSAVKAKSSLLFSTKVGHGDTVVVPEKFEKITWLREIRDITQIITNLALSAGVVIKVF